MSAAASSRAGCEHPARGIVRPARRPEGWVARGPAPSGFTDASDRQPGPGEDLCYLAGDWRIFQRLDGHRWSLDDLATAHYAVRAMREGRGRAPERFVDLGCGIGTVLLLLAWQYPEATGLGVEAQPLSVALARRSVRWNGVERRLTVREGDLRDPACWPEGPGFDLVTGTPPYLPPGSARESVRPQRGPCRIEHRGGIEEYCFRARRLLAVGGSFVTCAGGPDAERALAAARAADLATERLRAVVPRAGKPPLFWLFRMALDSAASPEVEPPLVVRDERGRRTPEMRRLREEMGMPP